MRKAIVFVAAFAAVLIAGAAFAFMATPGGDDVAEAAGEVIEESTTSSTFHEEEEKKEPPVEEEKEEPKEEKKEEPKEEVKEEEKDTEGPELVVLYPENGTHTTKGEFAYEGEVTPGAQLRVGDREVEVGEEGNWRIVLPLELGANYRIFVATNDGGKTTAIVKVWRDKEEPKEEPKEEKKEEPKEEEKEKEEPKEHDFWVKQKYGSCGEAEPYDKWYGEGKPGTEIWIVSDFGQGHTVIGESGEWHLKVYFNPETTPCNDEFAVVLETSENFRKVFEFIRFCEEHGEGEGEGGHEEGGGEGGGEGGHEGEK